MTGWVNLVPRASSTWLDLRPRQRLEMLAARDEVFLLHRDLVDNVQGVLDALFGLNRVYT